MSWRACWLSSSGSQTHGFSDSIEERSRHLTSPGAAAREQVVQPVGVIHQLAKVLAWNLELVIEDLENELLDARVGHPGAKCIAQIGAAIRRDAFDQREQEIALGGDRFAWGVRIGRDSRNQRTQLIGGTEQR